MNYRGFKELECWQKARELRNKVRILARKFPDCEKYKLIPQIKDSTRSVTRNIAEGYGRFTYSDTRHFFIQARGSVTETIDHLTVAIDEEYINNSEYDELDNLCESVFRLINGYVSYLDRQNNNKHKSPNS